MLTFHTLLESIALVAGLTDTGGDVVDDRAVCPPAASARAGIDTGPSRAGLGLAAVRVEDALWPAAVVRVAQQARGTGAPALTIRGCAGGSWTTGAGLAGVVLSYSGEFSVRVRVGCCWCYNMTGYHYDIF